MTTKTGLPFGKTIRGATEKSENWQNDFRFPGRYCINTLVRKKISTHRKIDVLAGKKWKSVAYMITSRISKTTATKNKPHTTLATFESWEEWRTKTLWQSSYISRRIFIKCFKVDPSLHLAPFFKCNLLFWTWQMYSLNHKLIFFHWKLSYSEMSS